MSLKQCPIHGSYNTQFCKQCEIQGLSLCVHCGVDMNSFDTIEKMLEHLKTHENKLDERSKKLLDFCEKIDYDEALKGNYNKKIKGV